MPTAYGKADMKQLIKKTKIGDRVLFGDREPRNYYTVTSKGHQDGYETVIVKDGNKRIRVQCGPDGVVAEGIGDIYYWENPDAGVLGSDFGAL